MIKTALLATVLMATVVTESQARPQIWRVLEEVAIASVTPPPVYYVEHPGHFYRVPPVRECRPQYFYREPRGRVVFDQYNRWAQDYNGNRYYNRGCR